MTTLQRDAASPAVERPLEVLAVAGALGIAAQWLLWDAGLGANAAVLLGLLLAAVARVAHRRGAALTAATAVVLGIAGAFSLALAVRAEPLTTAANLLTALGACAVLVHAYPSDRWLRYGLRDWLVAALRLAGHQATGAPVLLRSAVRRRGAASGPARWRGALPIVRGLVLAVPVVVVLAALLVSADAVFAERVGALVERLSVLQPGELTARTLLALVVAWGVAGALWHAVARRGPPALAEHEVPRVLGFTEAAIVLAAVDLLFAGFVAVQVRYLFGGEAAVVAEGLTYADYARRGFAELVVVAVVSLGLHLALAGLTRRETRRRQVAFSVLTVALTALVLVILASAFVRLLLYEQAFGFTRARVVAHVFMVWLGLLLVALAVLEVRDRVRLFLLAALVAAVGFTATLNVAGVDSLIVRHNLDRAAAGAELDLGYLAGLSPDAAPALHDAAVTAEGPLAEGLGAALACVLDRAEHRDWRALRLADLQARGLATGAGRPASATHCAGW